MARNAITAASPSTRATFITTTTAARELSTRRPEKSAATHRLQPTSLRPSFTTFRHASSDSASTSATTTSEDILTWDRFFDLRRKRRYINLSSSLVTAGATIFVAAPMMAQQDIDGWAAQIYGLDPIMVLGATTFAVATGGWLCGPSFGTALFKVWAGRKGWNGPIAEVRMKDA